MTKKLLVLIPLLAAAAGGYIWTQQTETRPASDSLVLYGNIDIRQIDLAFEVSGRIAQMLAAEGERVAAAAPLARLDPQRLQLSLAAATAKVSAQREVLKQLEAGSRPEEIAKLRAELAAAQAEERNAEKTRERVVDLVNKKLASMQQADDSRAAAEAAHARARALDAALALGLAGPRAEDIAAARAQLAALDAERELAVRNLTDAELRAPAAGVIQSRVLEPGDMASPQQPVYTLALTDPLWARSYLAGPDLGKVRPGMTAYVESDSFPGKQYPGWVGYLSPTAEFTPKSVETTEVRTQLVYQVRIFVCDSQDQLRLGMPVTVIIPLGRERAGDTVTNCKDR